MYEVKYDDVDCVVEDDGIIITNYKSNEVDIAFPDSFKISGLDIPIVEIKNKTFDNISDLRSVSLPAFLDEIPIDLFYKQIYLESVHLGDNVKTIGSYAFYGCLSLKEINLDKILTIKANAFNGCKRLNKLSLENCNCGNNAFFESVINELELKNCEIRIDCFESAYINIMDLHYTNIFNYSFNSSVVNNLIIADDSQPDFSAEDFALSAITICNFAEKPFLNIKSSKSLKVINKLDYNTLINNNYNDLQINQILLGYNDGILLNMFPPSVDVSVFRLVREKIHENKAQTLTILNSFPDFVDCKYIDKLIKELNKVSPDKELKEVFDQIYL